MSLNSFNETFIVEVSLLLNRGGYIHTLQQNNEIIKDMIKEI